MRHTKDRPQWLNIVTCFLSIVMYFIVAKIIAAYCFKFINNEVACSIIGVGVYILILIFVYYKDLAIEFNNLKKDFKNCIKKGFKYYFAGLLGMVFFNLVISITLKDISANESAVRELLYNSPILTMLEIMIIAPLSEEIMFRKSVWATTKNKWIFALISGILFGGAHLITGGITLSTLIYILPYGSLGFVFALMDYETNSTFTSMIMHAFHNTMTGLLLLLVYSMGIM